MMEEMIEYAAEISLPLVVAGDFNMSLGHDLSLKARALQAGLYDKWENAGLCSAYHQHFDVDFGMEREPTVYGTSGQKAWKYHIDYIWYDREAFDLELVKLQMRLKSDHAPVTAILR